MYNGGAYGRIKAKSTPFNIRVMQAMAHRVANISLPAGKYSIFDKLREKAVRQFGNMGMAQDYRKQLMAPQNYLGGMMPQLPIEMQQERRRAGMQYDTRADVLRRQAGANAMSMPMIGQPPQAGIASAHDDHGPGPHGVKVPGAAGGPMGAADGDPRVNDSGWSVTLSQIVGSGMLTQQQLQQASFNNVYSMINATGMTDTEKREMTYYLQRMILEGYVRGVDMVREIKAQNNGKVNIGLASSVCGGGYDGCGDWGSNTVTFRNTWWRNSTDKLKLALFYHELGHAILNRPHSSNYSIMQLPYNQISGTWQSNSQYKVLVDELFRNHQNSRVSSTVQRGNIPVNQALAILNGGPIPPGTPTSPNSPTGPGPTGPDGQPIPPDINIMNNMSPPMTIMNTYNPPQINEMGGGSVQGPTGGGGYNPGTPRDADKTPVAGTLPDMAAVHTFAAGLQEANARGSGTLQGLAGALQKFKHG